MMTGSDLVSFEFYCPAQALEPQSSDVDFFCELL